MKLSHLRSLFVICMFISLSVVPVFSQGTGDTPQPAEEAQMSVPAADVQSQAKEIAIYGEVQAVDAAACVIAVQYYDYDSDSEKTADVAVAGDSRLENVASLGDIKKGDWVDVTYIAKDGKNAAKIVTVEKEESPAAEEAAPEAAMPISEPSE